MRRAATATVLALLLSGCSGGTEGPPTVETIDVDGYTVAPDAGVLAGRVVDDVNRSLAGASVSLLGSDFFTRTGDTGGFTFVNVTAGDYKLSVTADGFQATSIGVTVTAAQKTDVAVLMVPDAQVGAGYRPHAHDLWKGQSTYIVMDAAMSLMEEEDDSGPIVPILQAQRAVVRPNQGSSDSSESTWWPIPIIEEGSDGVPLILPGTKAVTVTATWDMEDTNIDFGLRWRPASGGDWRVESMRGSGEPWRLEIEPGDADSGHQLFSLWKMYLIADSAAQRGRPGYALGEVHISIELEKGEVLPEPAHQDRWGDADALVLRPADPPEESQQISVGPRDADHYGVHLSKGQIVPPGTERMRVDMTHTPSIAGAYPEYKLTWRTGDQNPHTTSVKEFRRAEPIVDEPGHRVYEFDLDPTWTDAFYQQRSNWVFVPWIEGMEEDGFHIDPRSREWAVEITAYRNIA